ncbi:hypothetical protein ACA910_010709 [Epithemia clementina (nom. ined.)]
MGGSSSKQKDADEENSKGRSFLRSIKQNVEDEVAKRAMMQREVQMALNIAKARDTLVVFGSAWATLVSGVVAVRAMGRPVPGLVGVPIVVGGLVLGNIADMAYGNKLNRVVNEAEYIMEHERARFVPPKQAPFAKFYSDEERKLYCDEATPVGDILPNSLLFPRRKN